MKVVEANNISKTFGKQDSAVEVLTDVNFILQKSEVVSLVGPSGSGKTTFLQILGLLSLPDSGSLKVAQVECMNLSEQEIINLRRNQIGYIYQSHHLLPEFSVLENVALPLMIKGLSEKKAGIKAINILKELDLENRANFFPSELSGGQKQRVAIARALVHSPQLILADEPTGNLDDRNAQIVIDLIIKEIKSRAISAVIVTHNLEIAKKTDRILTIKDKKIVKLF